MADIKTLYKSNPRDILSCMKVYTEDIESGELKPINVIIIIEEEDRVTAGKMGEIGGDVDNDSQFIYLLDFIKAAYFDNLFHDDEDEDD